MKTKGLPPLDSERVVQGLTPRFLIVLCKLGPRVKQNKLADGGKGRVWNPSDLDFRLSTMTTCCAIWGKTL